MQDERARDHEAVACPFFPALSAYLVLLSAIQVQVIVASLASLRLTRPLAAGILLVSLLAAWIAGRRLNAGATIATAWDAAADLRWGRRIAGAFVVFYFFLFACAALVADPSWDGNTYHLPTIQQWYQNGRVIWIEGGADNSTAQFMNGFPKAAELLSFFLSALLHPALSNTHNLVYLPLGMLGVASLAHALGATSTAAAVAGAALMLVPLHMGQSPTTYVDSAFGSAVIGWLAATVHLRRLDPRRSVWQALVLACALGQIVGVKGTGLLLGALGSLALAAIHLLDRATRRSLAKVVGWWLGVALCAFCVGGLWYARNLAHGFSLFYPAAVKILGVTLWPGFDTGVGAFAVDGMIEPWPQPARIAFTWLQGVWNWPRSIVGFDSRLGALGFLWPLGCLPAIVALVRWRLRSHGPWRRELVDQPLWLMLVITVAGFVLLPFPWWARFSVWIYGLGLPCLAAVFSWPRGRWGRAWRMACVGIALVEAGIAVARWQVPLLRTALAGWRGSTYPQIRYPTHFYPPPNMRGTIIEQITRGSDSVGVGALEWYQEPLLGVVSQPVGARQIHLLPADVEADFGAWYERIRPRYVMMTKRDLPPSMSALAPQVHLMGSLMVLQFW